MTSRWNGRDPHDRDALIERHLPLARSLAARYRGSDEPLDDLFQVACIGLLHAADRFDPSRGTAFSTFAVPTILGEIRRHFRDRTWAMRVPRHAQELFLRLERTRDALTSELGREPTVAELGAHVGADEEAVLQALELHVAYRSVSLDGPPVADPDAVPDRMPGAVDDGYEQAEQRAVLDALMPALTPREAEILRLRFREDLTQEAIGRRLGISQMQVSRVLHRSIGRLREAAAMGVTATARGGRGRG